MIKTFRNKALEQFWASGTSRKLSVENVPRLRRILLSLAEAFKPEDMNLPGYYFHGLSGNPKRWSVRVSGNWRVTFSWEGIDAIDIDLEDYH